MVRTDAITLKQLRALAAVYDSGSLVAATERLNVTAPAISTQLKTLEDNIGAALLRRRDGQLELTEPGRELLAATAQVEHTLERTFRRLSALKSGMAGQVEVGVVSTGKYFAPGLVARARKALPEISTGLRVGNRSEIVAAVANRSIDLAIMGRPPRVPVVTAHRLGEHPHILVAPPEHKLAGRRDIETGLLLDEMFLLREIGSGTRILAERFLDRIGEGKAYESLDFDSNET
ncbi:MAG TPA: LysR family transcriptional regulator, partial [Devosiaceae bacterium]|nr:LysR family transcriptional regulator [Devosiaceae bacterium]